MSQEMDENKKPDQEKPEAEATVVEQKAEEAHLPAPATDAAEASTGTTEAIEGAPASGGSDFSNEVNTPPPPKKGMGGLLAKFKNSQKATFLFGIVAVITVVIIIIVTLAARQVENNFGNVELSSDEIATLSAAQNQVESSAQVLTIGPNTEFNGTVLVKNSLEVIGDFTVGGKINTPGGVFGDSTTEAPTSGDLNVQGNALIAGGLTTQGSLTVNGDATISGELIAGSISASSIVFSGDATFSRHITTAAGSTTSGSGGAVGGGGTTSVSGNDIAGTANINTGGSPSTGALITINFRQAYGKTPKVLVSPIGSAAGQFDYYVIRSANSFTIFARTSPPGSATIQFDYFVVE